MDDYLYRCMTKATTAEGDDIRHSVSWMLSRRAFLKVYKDRLECGDWIIPYEAMSEAVLFRTRQLLIPCYVLRVKALGRIYQFGLNPGKFWEADLPFPVRREQAALGYSWFSIGIRLAAVLALVYLLWTWYR
jgi:hypothetical protein